MSIEILYGLIGYPLRLLIKSYAPDHNIASTIEVAICNGIEVDFCHDASGNTKSLRNIWWQYCIFVDFMGLCLNKQ